MEKTDRYTTFEKKPDELGQVAHSCAELGLYWFAVQEFPGLRTCRVYVFLDRAGMRNYLRGEYDPDNPRGD